MIGRIFIQAASDAKSYKIVQNAEVCHFSKMRICRPGILSGSRR